MCKTEFQRAIQLFRPEVFKYLEEHFSVNKQLSESKEKQQWESPIVQSLLIPPSVSSVRVNTALMRLNSSDKEEEEKREDSFEQIMENAKELLSKLFNNKFEIKRDPFIKDCLTIPVIEMNPTPKEKYVVIDRKCGEAVMRGANIYVPGILGMSMPDAQEMETVSIICDVYNQSKKGKKFTNPIIELLQTTVDPLQFFTSKKQKKLLNNNEESTVTSSDKESILSQSYLYLGNGKMLMNRKDLIQTTSGVAVELTEPLYKTCSLNQLNERLEFYAQNIPSMITVHLLDPKPNERVLDLCAAPGGKSLHICNLMENKGELVSCDKNKSKVGILTKLKERYNLQIMKCLQLDGTKATFNRESKKEEKTDIVNEEKKEEPKKKKKKVNNKSNNSTVNSLLPESFDKVLVDAPCSGLGQRPNFSFLEFTLNDLKEVASYQRKLLVEGKNCLKKGGYLVYSTCSINPMENEENVLWFLEQFKGEIELVEPEIKEYSREGLESIVKDEHTRRKMLRFDPITTSETIGFFAVKFKKL